MFRAKLYRTDRDTLLAASDEELVGRKVRFGAVDIEIAESFYGADPVTEDELVDSFRECTIANLMGSRTIAVARRLGLIRDGNVLDLGGVPHAQLARMR